MASLNRDLEIDEPPLQWTDEWVRFRLVEAYRIELRLPGEARRKIVTLWPAHAYEFADVVGWDDARERVLENWANTRETVYSDEVSRMEQAQEWLRVQLGGHYVERICLAHWATSIAFGKSVRGLLARKRWSRTTFYRRVLLGSQIIASALRREGVEVR